MSSGFGDLLRDWRKRRRVSQLDLGLTANVSARHIAFLETGRSRPSRDMVVRLADALMVPVPERNGLFTAAGFAALHRQRAVGDADLAHAQAALDWMLERHDPFPGFALDRHWTLLRVNATAAALFAAVGIGVGDSLLEAVLHAPAFRGAIENWDEFAYHLSVRLRTESAHLGGDPVLTAAANRLAAGADPARRDAAGPLPVVLATRYRAGPRVLSLFSVIAQFGSAEDIALADLKIELLFPAHAETRAALVGMSC